MTLPKPEEIADLKPLHVLETPYQDYALVAFVLLALVGFAFLIMRLLKAKKMTLNEHQGPNVPLIHWAVPVKDTLSRLSSLSPLEIEELRKNYFELSATLKIILEKLTETNMTELTSKEILERLFIKSGIDSMPGENPRPSLHFDEITSVKDFFARTDLLLFAKQNIGSDHFRADCAWVSSLFAKALQAEKEPR